MCFTLWPRTLEAEVPAGEHTEASTLGKWLGRFGTFGRNFILSFFCFMKVVIYVAV
jgi:hypothetical protein